MPAQVLLQVQDGQCVALVQGQQLAERGISLDGLLIHQVVGAGIGHHTLGHRGAAHLSVLGLSQEGAELGADLHGLGEDAGLGLSTLHGLSLALAPALGLLDDTGGLLLHNLEGCGGSAEGGLQGAQLLVEIIDGLLESRTDVLLNGGGLGGRGDHLHSGGGSNRGCCLGGNSGLRGLGGLGGNRSCSSNGDSNGLGGLGGLLGSLDGGTHFGVIGGSN